MSVKRYEFEFCQSVECENGHYVLHSDYAELEARHNELVEAVKKYFKSERLEILKRDARAEVDRLLMEEQTK